MTSDGDPAQDVPPEALSGTPSVLWIKDEVAEILAINSDLMDHLKACRRGAP